ncbi:MAG: 30S ribosomal protein S11 [Bacteroidetes bacterium]|nr:30S ribosomal protein S11 [Bacteroidota bacterium]MCB9226890.1 30S ribosomal protein S11 [Chitinophagales bacterium]
MATTKKGTGKGKTTAKGKAKKNSVKVGNEGKVFIKATFNNIIVTFANSQGETISWGSAGKAGFRGSKKNTPYAAQVAVEDAAKTAYDAGMRKAEVFVKGPGSGRESAIRTVAASGIEVTLIKDTTPIPHNGCRPPKRRRV